MKVGIDFDGTLADTNALKSAWIKQYLNIDVPPHLTDRTSCVPIIGEESYKKMGENVYSLEATRNLTPMPGALQVLARLVEKHSLVVITARSGWRRDAVTEWLSSHPPAHGLSVITGTGSEASKGETCRKENVRILIDDDERHVLPAQKMGIAAILFKQSAPIGFQSQCLHLCRSWAEIEQIIARLCLF